MLNYDFIEKKALESKIDKFTIAREYYQLIFLQRLYLEKGSENIYFKGGTAIRFLFNSFRFSEDLDFTSTADKNKTEKILTNVFNFFIKSSADQVEIKKEKVWDKFSDISLKYRFLFFPSGYKQKVSIRIDVSLREKPKTKEESVLVPFDYPIFPYPLVVHLTGEELLAEKIRAFFVRGKPRDLFDLWFLLTKKIPINEKLIKEKFRLYKEIKFSPGRLEKIIADYDEREIKKDLNQFLPENYRNLYQKLKKMLLDELKGTFCSE